jgi:hypothetical protein
MNRRKVVAEAFHHLGNERAVAEITRVLRLGGSLVLMWNLPAGPWEPSIAAVNRLLREHLSTTEELAMTRSTSTTAAMQQASGVRRSQRRVSRISKSDNSPIRRPWTEKGYWHISLRWDGLLTSPMKIDFRCSKK